MNNPLRSAFEYFTGFRKQEKFDVYCQHCGNDLTQSGGDVTNTSSIYCHGYKETSGTPVTCMHLAIFGGTEFRDRAVIANHYSPEKVQRAIKKGDLTKFGKLEENLLEDISPN